MEDVEELSGNLQDAGVSRLVGLLARRRATGALELETPTGTHRGFFLDGVPQGARLAGPAYPLGEILVEQGVLDAQSLQKALEIHHETGKLLGQILLEMQAISNASLDAARVTQSRRSFFYLFAFGRGRFRFWEGLVNLVDFTPAPVASMDALYEGLRRWADHAALTRFAGHLAFSGISLRGEAEPWFENLGAAERMVIELLAQPRLSGELAQAVPLEPKALAALLLAISELGLLHTTPALRTRWRRIRSSALESAAEAPRAAAGPAGGRPPQR